jgi:hypothetical protein
MSPLTTDTWIGRRAAELGLTNVRYEVRDLGDFDMTSQRAAYDLVLTFDAIHDQARPGQRTCYAAFVARCVKTASILPRTFMHRTTTTRTGVTRSARCYTPSRRLTS